jgi:hypothetical protein
MEFLSKALAEHYGLNSFFGVSSKLELHSDAGILLSEETHVTVTLY